MPPWASAPLEELPDLPTSTQPGDPAWKPIRHVFGLAAFGINAYIARATGDTLAGEHDERESGHEELYLVTAGRARFVLDGEELLAEAGTVVAVPDPSVRRAASALEPGTRLLAIGSRPGCFESTWRPEHYVGVPTR
jgi:mannose-6-phosphate isomerase-like protein (cupin superfamily)